MACNSKSHRIMLWHVISMKLNIGKKITRLEIMTLDHKKNQHASKLVELMLKGDVLESRQVVRTFKNVNPKHED